MKKYAEGPFFRDVCGRNQDNFHSLLDVAPDTHMQLILLWFAQVVLGIG